ncbi:MAG TPA: hypothetical protein VGR37_19555 [Longimicrobiaceae bacterium]|nr:hypothetical protein [Longimicrobiaceae bacterium]
MRPAPPPREDRLQFVFAFVMVYGAVLFLVRPDPTPAQVRLRLGMMLVGALGVAAVGWRRRRR